MTIFVCSYCLKTVGCINVQTTHELKCRGENITCPCVRKLVDGSRISTCDIHDHPEDYNKHYIETKGLCSECAKEGFSGNTKGYTKYQD